MIQIRTDGRGGAIWQGKKVQGKRKEGKKGLGGTETDSHSATARLSSAGFSLQGCWPGFQALTSL